MARSSKSLGTPGLFETMPGLNGIQCDNNGKNSSTTALKLKKTTPEVREAQSREAKYFYSTVV